MMLSWLQLVRALNPLIKKLACTLQRHCVRQHHANIRALAAAWCQLASTCGKVQAEHSFRKLFPEGIIGPGLTKASHDEHVADLRNGWQGGKGREKAGQVSSGSRGSALDQYCMDVLTPDALQSSQCITGVGRWLRASPQKDIMQASPLPCFSGRQSFHTLTISAKLCL